MDPIECGLGTPMVLALSRLLGCPLMLINSHICICTYTYIVVSMCSMLICDPRAIRMRRPHGFRVNPLLVT